MSTADEQIQHVRSILGDDGARFADAWIRYALRTAPIEPDVIVPAIEALYGVAGLGTPRVVIVPSPGAMAFAGTFAAKIWARRDTDPTYDPARAISGVISVPPRCKAIVTATAEAIRSATTLPHRTSARNSISLGDAILAATYNPADLATVNALPQEDWSELRDGVEQMEALSYWNECIRDAMRDDFGNPTPTEMIVEAARDWAQPLAVALFGDNADAQDAIREAANWWRHSQSGNHWLHDTACIAAARDLRMLSLPEHRSFAVWERCQTNGGHRYLHPQFCLVCDFPETMDELSMDHPTQVRRQSLEQRRAAPVIRWRDGWFV
jgi:hypothetical protein